MRRESRSTQLIDFFIHLGVRSLLKTSRAVVLVWGEGPFRHHAFTHVCGCRPPCDPVRWTQEASGAATPCGRNHGAYLSHSRTRSCGRHSTRSKLEARSNESRQQRPDMLHRFRTHRVAPIRVFNGGEVADRKVWHGAGQPRHISVASPTAQWSLPHNVCVLLQDIKAWRGIRAEHYPTGVR